MKEIIIIGAGGHGRETVQLIKDINQNQPTWKLIGFIDDRAELQGKQINGIDVIGPLSQLGDPVLNHAHLICAVGDSGIRRHMLTKIDTIHSSYNYATLIHPTAVVGERVRISEGTMICAQCVITTDIVIGRHVIVNYCSSIGHDCHLEDGVTVLPGARISGNVHLGQGSSLGAGAVVLPGLDVGEETIVGAGAVVTASLPARSTAVGVPAKVIKIHNKIG
ncbi:acetyltransferase [Paenibacillus chitinolyticus]|uniref:acetyltransferase n=1 Tax=Paenibacillus chitinolyticus TaxID=79263 RepID=UPI003D052AE2